MVVRSLSKMVLPLIAAVLCATATRASAAEAVAVGVAKIDITPEHPVRMYGYCNDVSTYIVSKRLLNEECKTPVSHGKTHSGT